MGHQVISGEGYSLQFELLKAGKCLKMHEMPRGEVGRICEWDVSGFKVSFPSGCVLHVELLGRSGMRVGRIEILSCDVEEPFVVLLRMLLYNRSRPYFMIPAVLYGTNNAGRGVVAGHPGGVGADPQLDYRAREVRLDLSLSPGWHFRSDRSSMPSVSATFDGHFVALGIGEASEHSSGEWVYNSVGVWTSPDHGDSISVAMGTLNWPARLICHRFEDSPSLEPLTKGNAVGMAAEFCVYAGPAEDMFAYEPFLVDWYRHIHEPPREGPPLEWAMRDVADALVEDGIHPNSGYFHMYLDDEGFHGGTLLAWAGILQIARPLIRTGFLLGEEGYIKTAADMVERVLKEAFNPKSGLFYDIHQDGRWQANTWWPCLGHTSLVNGHACYLLLKMYEDDPGRRDWAETAGRMLKKVVEHQREDGRFPSGFSPDDGRPTTYMGYGGCFFVAPLLMYHRLFGDVSTRGSGLRALEHYWEEFERLEWIGVDLDCRGAVDSGSSYALIRALVELHRQEGDPKVLERLGHVLHYAFSYHFGHNTRHRNPVCDWSSSGSKVTSTHNAHIDAYGGSFLEDVLYYVEQTGDGYFLDRLRDSVTWARQAYNFREAEYGWGKVGWVTEQFYHTYDRYHHLEGDGTVWQAYFPWAAGTLLDAYIIGVRLRESSGGWEWKGRT